MGPASKLTKPANAGNVASSFVSFLAEVPEMELILASKPSFLVYDPERWLRPFIGSNTSSGMLEHAVHNEWLLIISDI
jgi:hypothetical protein